MEGIKNKEVTIEKLVKESYKNIAGIVVEKEGTPLYESYYNGCTAENTIHIASATKSIISALFGIAIEKGCIKSVNQKVLDFFPEYKIPEGETTIQQVTIKDMITMTAPYKCEEEPYVEVMSNTHWVEAALNLLGGNKKIGDFFYSPMIGVHILSGILVKATGMSVLQFAEENFFSPLGIHGKETIVLQSVEENYAFLKSKTRNGWAVDPEGIHTAGWGLTLSPREMAKIGQLYLQGGVWEGKQVLSQDWVKDSTKVHSKWNQLSYGYLWWILDDESYAALGQYGNVIYVNHKKQIVISIVSLYTEDEKDLIEFIKRDLEPMCEG